MDWRTDFYEARYHLDIAKRMLGSFDEYGGKRFLIGVIREGAKAAGRLVRAFLIRDEVKGDLSTFMSKVAPKHLSDVEICGIVGILNLERDQRRARVEFLKKGKILLEVDGGWRVLEISRLREIVAIMDNIASNF